MTLTTRILAYGKPHTPRRDARSRPELPHASPKDDALEEESGRENPSTHTPKDMDDQDPREPRRTNVPKHEPART